MLHFSEPTSRPFSAISKAYQLVTQLINLIKLIPLCLKYSVTNSYRFNVSQLYFYSIGTMMYNFIIANQLLSTNNTLQFIVKNGTLTGSRKTIKDYVLLHITFLSFFKCCIEWLEGGLPPP